MKKIFVVLFSLMFVFLLAFAVSCVKNERDVRGTYKLYVEYENDVADVLFVYTVGNADAGQKQIFFTLAANAEYLNKFNVCAFNFLSVKVNNQLAKYQISGEKKDFLGVSKSKSFEYGDSIQIEYSLKLQNNIGGLGINGETVDFAMFYPLKCVIKNGKYLLLPQNKIAKFSLCDYADYFLSVTVKSTYILACGLSVMSCEVQGEKTTYKYQGEKVLNVEFVLSEKFAVDCNKSGYKPINYYYNNDEQVQNTVSQINKAMAFFGGLTAEYPHADICVAQTAFGCDFAESSHIMRLPDDKTYTSNDYLKVVQSAARLQIYSVISIDKYNCGYFYEGLCEYLVYKYYEKNNLSLAQQIKERAEKMYDSYKSACKKLDLPVKSKLKYSLGCFFSPFEYSCVCKCGGLLFFLKLEKAVGEKAFLQGLKYFVSNYYLQAVTERDFINSFLKNKKNVNLLFKEYAFT